MHSRLNNTLKTIKKTSRRDLFFLSVLFFLTLSAPLGFILKINPLRKLGLASLASPLMIVYSELDGEKSMRYKYDLEISLKNNSKENIHLDKYKYLELSKAENIFNRHILIIPYMAATFMLYESEKSLVLRNRILKFGLCNNGPYSKYLGLKNDVLNTRITITNSKQALVNELKLTCD